MNANEQKKTIKQWAPDDRPREKLLDKGKKALSDAELIAIIIGSGVHGNSAVDIARKILDNAENNLSELSRMEVSDLMKFEGIGEARAISIVAAIELGRRRSFSDALKRTLIKSSHDAYEFLKPMLSDLKHEEFYVLYLNRQNQVMRCECISQGGVAGTVVDVRIICKKALDLLAVSLILGHNHPSGSVTPSEQDKQITKKVSDGAALLDIQVLDHIIVGGNKYLSFSDEGLM